MMTVYNIIVILPQEFPNSKDRCPVFFNAPILFSITEIDIALNPLFSERFHLFLYEYAKNRKFRGRIICCYMKYSHPITFLYSSIYFFAETAISKFFMAN